MKAFIMCGLIGSGKSTKAKQLAKENNALLICKDKLREMIYGKYAYKEDDEVLIDNIVYGIIKNFSFFGVNMVIDECHLKTYDRFYLIKILKKLGYNVTLIFCLENKTNLKNRANNLRGISLKRWGGVLETQKQQLEKPTKEECNKLGIDYIEWNIP